MIRDKIRDILDWRRSEKPFILIHLSVNADVAKLADALDLGSSSREGV